MKVHGGTSFCMYKRIFLGYIPRYYIILIGIISGFARWSREELRCKKPTQRCTDFNGKVYKEKKKDKIGKNINCINLKKIWNYILKAL